MAAVLIKKYGNRRLYDTGESRYITLDELAAKIRTGTDVRVLDAQTSEDLTQATLTQIVLETGNAAKFLPVQLLTQMIRLSDDSLAEFFSRYVTGALDLYLQAKRGVQSIASYNPLTQLPMAATDALARLWMGSPFAASQYGYAYAPGPPPQPAPPAEHREPADIDDADAPRDLRRDETRRDDARRDDVRRDDARRDDDVAAMRRELDELKQLIRDNVGAKSPRKKRKP